MFNNLRKLLQGEVSHNKQSLNSCFYLLSLAVVLATSAINIARADVCFLPDGKGCEQVPYEEYGGVQNQTYPKDCYATKAEAMSARTDSMDSYYKNGDTWCIKPSCSGYDVASMKPGSWDCQNCNDANSLNYNKYKCSCNLEGATPRSGYTIDLERCEEKPNACPSYASTNCVPDECHECNSVSSVNPVYSGGKECLIYNTVNAHCPDGYVTDKPSSKCYSTQDMLCGEGKCYKAATTIPDCSGEGKQLSDDNGACWCSCKTGYHSNGNEGCAKDCAVVTCNAVTIPANAHGTTTCQAKNADCSNNGSEVYTAWECDTGYHKNSASTACVANVGSCSSGYESKDPNVSEEDFIFDWVLDNDDYFAQDCDPTQTQYSHGCPYALQYGTPLSDGTQCVKIKLSCLSGYESKDPNVSEEDFIFDWTWDNDSDHAQDCDPTQTQYSQTGCPYALQYGTPLSDGTQCVKVVNVGSCPSGYERKDPNVSDEKFIADWTYDNHDDHAQDCDLNYLSYHWCPYALQYGTPLPDGTQCVKVVNVGSCPKCFNSYDGGCYRLVMGNYEVGGTDRISFYSFDLWIESATPVNQKKDFDVEYQVTKEGFESASFFVDDLVLNSGTKSFTINTGNSKSDNWETGYDQDDTGQVTYMVKVPWEDYLVPVIAYIDCR